MAEEGTRVERDSMGEVRVPADAFYGASTQRARQNFPISNLRLPRRFIRSLAQIKGAAALVNAELGLLETRLANPIQQAAEEVEEGKFDKDFVVDVFQTGSGTSTNTNANEVIANRANEILGQAHARPQGERVHAGHQDRPDALAGRDADPARPGVRGLYRPAASIAGSGPAHRGRARRVAAGRHGGGNRHQRPSRVRPARLIAPESPRRRAGA